MQRREFLKSGAALAGAWATGRVGDALPPAIPIIDTHIHLFDNTRPVFTGYTGGLFYRALNKPSTPTMYALLARPAGIVGAIVVESAAQFIDDNLWYLE